MASSTRIMVRLSPELYTHLEACRRSTGQPLAAIARQALSEYLAQLRQQPGAATEQPPSSQPVAAQLAALTTAVQVLHDQLQAMQARLDALAAGAQPRAATIPQGAATEQPEAVGEQPHAATSSQPAPQDVPTHYGRPGLAPATLQAIAEARARHPTLSLKAFAQYLFDQGIYRGRARDGREVPADHSRLRRWLAQAHKVRGDV